LDTYICSCRARLAAPKSPVLRRPDDSFPPAPVDAGCVCESAMDPPDAIHQETLQIPIESTTLDGDLAVPTGATGVVLFAHGSGSGRQSPRNRFVARAFQRSGLATALVDLLTPAETALDLQTAKLRFDIDLLAKRLEAVVFWLSRWPTTKSLRVGLFGASTGAAAALVVAAHRPEAIGAIVSRGGRPDLAARALPVVKSPTLLIVGSEDTAVIGINRRAIASLKGIKRLEMVQGATHLFEEPGALGQVAALASTWFRRYLGPVPDSPGLRS